MNTFQSSELFGGFLVFIVVFSFVAFLDYLYHHCKSNKNEKLVYDAQHHTFRFHIKQRIACLMLKIAKRKKLNDIEANKLQIFSDADQMVNK